MLLPGVLENWAIMRMVGDQLNLAGHPVHALRELGSNTVPVSEGARIVERELVDRDLEDVVLVAHSKGGLIGKQVMLGPEGWRIRRLVAVATPFHGSRLAKLIPHPMVRAFDPHDPTIVELASRDVVDHRIVSICPSFDPHIPEGSHLARATNVPVTASGHFRVLASPEVLAAIRHAVAEAA